MSIPTFNTFVTQLTDCGKKNGLAYGNIVCMWDGKEGIDYIGLHHRRMFSETSKGVTYKETFHYLVNEP